MQHGEFENIYKKNYKRFLRS